MSGWVGALLVALGAGVGAPSRHLTNQLLRTRFGATPTAGTLSVNVIGSFVLGLMAGAGIDRAGGALIGGGFCGAYTTFSTLAVDTVRLGDGHEQLALLYVAATFVVGILAVGLGILIGRRTWPDISGAQEDS